MVNQDLQSKKRKRKHRSAKEAGPAAVVANDMEDAQAAGTTVDVEKKYKKRKRDSHEEVVAVNIAHQEVPAATSALDPEFKEAQQAPVENVDGNFALSTGEKTSEDPPDAEDDASNIPSTTSLSLPATGPDPTKFSELHLSEKTMKAIEGMGFGEMTEIQQRGIPPLLAGRDVLGKHSDITINSILISIRRRKNGLGEDARLPNPGSRDAKCFAVQASQWYWSSYSVADKRVGAADIWCCPRTYGTSLSNVWDSHGGC